MWKNSTDKPITKLKQSLRDITISVPAYLRKMPRFGHVSFQGQTAGKESSMTQEQSQRSDSAVILQSPHQLTRTPSQSRRNTAWVRTSIIPWVIKQTKSLSQMIPTAYSSTEL